MFSWVQQSKYSHLLLDTHVFHRLLIGISNAELFSRYIPNRLLWCGGSGPDGINYTYCPGLNECGFEVYYPYWAYASQQVRIVTQNCG